MAVKNSLQESVSKKSDGKLILQKKLTAKNHWRKKNQAKSVTSNIRQVNKIYDWKYWQKKFLMAKSLIAKTCVWLQKFQLRQKCHWQRETVYNQTTKSRTTKPGSEKSDNGKSVPKNLFSKISCRKTLQNENVTTRIPAVNISKKEKNPQQNL